MTDEVSVLRICLKLRYCNATPHPPRYTRHLLPGEKAFYRKSHALLRRGELRSPLRLFIICEYTNIIHKIDRLFSVADVVDFLNVGRQFVGEHLMNAVLVAVSNGGFIIPAFEFEHCKRFL